MSIVNELIKNINNSSKSVSKFLSLEEQVQLNKVKNKVFFPIDSERKRVIIFKNDIEEFKIDDYISIIKISYNKKFGEINHRDVLGSIIGLGIKRECIGDIIVDEDIFVYVIKEMEHFIVNNLIKIGRVSVDVKTLRRIPEDKSHCLFLADITSVFIDIAEICIGVSTVIDLFACHKFSSFNSIYGNILSYNISICKRITKNIKNMYGIL